MQNGDVGWEEEKCISLKIFLGSKIEPQFLVDKSMLHTQLPKIKNSRKSLKLMQNGDVGLERDTINIIKHFSKI